MQEASYHIPEGFHAEIEGNRVVIKRGEQKPTEWTEEDETIKNNISHIIRQYDKISKKDNQPCWYVGDCLLWIQNIKDRVLPQPKLEWNEEDDDDAWLNDIISKAECNLQLNKDEITWLKSLKDRYTWKPSDKQMEAVRIAAEIGTANNSWAMGILKDMYQDLKKLREEDV